jgi:hypothetical protein
MEEDEKGYIEVMTLQKVVVKKRRTQNDKTGTKLERNRRTNLCGVSAVRSSSRFGKVKKLADKKLADNRN